LKKKFTAKPQKPKKELVRLLAPPLKNADKQGNRGFFWRKCYTIYRTCGIYEQYGAAGGTALAFFNAGIPF
jgi:hypothetical protein